MKDQTRVVGYIKTLAGKHYIREDKFDMEVHDLIDYLTFKYVTRGHRLATIPVKFITELGRAETKLRKHLEDMEKKE